MAGHLPPPGRGRDDVQSRRSGDDLRDEDRAAAPRGVRFSDKPILETPEAAKRAEALEAAFFGDAADASAAEDRERARRRRNQAYAEGMPPAATPGPPKPAVTAPVPAGAPSHDEENAEDEDSDGSFDLFAEDEPAGAPSSAASASASAPALPSAAGSSAAAAVDSAVADDAEGYLRLSVGDSVAGRYTVTRVAGQGVFATVVLCQDEAGATHAATSTQTASVASSSVAAVPGRAGEMVAIKVARANDTMRTSAMKEAGILASIAAADRLDRRHIIRLLGVFEWRGHVCLVFEPMQLNLRELIDRYGKNRGLSAAAVRTFGRQLLSALDLLASLGIVHADIKPQNVVVSSALTSCRLCDLGSAFRANGPDNVATPMLVSRFYRAPEVILGLAHTAALDLWSVGCVLFEMFTGSPLFTGSDNEAMLLQMMELCGPVHAKLARAHLRQCEALGFEPHFDADLRFLQHTKDPVTGEVITRATAITSASTDLAARLAPPTLHGAERRAALQLRDLLCRILVLDRRKRISVREALAHPFFEADNGAGLGSATADAAAASAVPSAPAGSSDAAAHAPPSRRRVSAGLKPAAALASAGRRGAPAWQAPKAWTRR